MARQQDSSDAPSSIDDLLQEGWSCLRRRHWAPAGEAFRNALAMRDMLPVAWEGLAAAAICLDDAETSRSAYERAYREYLDGHDVRGAARAAMHLAIYHGAYRGESAIASGWFERARTLLETVPTTSEHAWLAFWKAHLDIHVRGDLAKGEPHLDDAVRLTDACQIGGELALMTRGLRGLIELNAGAIDEGLRRLDETTTQVICGDLPSPQAVGWTYCYVLEACERVRDFDRALQWMSRAWESIREMNILHFAGFCRSHYVGILTWRGDYAGAAREIDTLRGELGEIAPVYAVHCDIRLGEIRRRQGRWDEAATLLEPHVAQPMAMVSLAALAIDRQQPQLAIDLVERYFRRLSPGERVRQLHGLELLVRAQVQRGDLAAARERLNEARTIGDGSLTPWLSAMLLELTALVEVAAGQLETARCQLEDAIDGYNLSWAPYEATAARLRLGEVLVALDRAEVARHVRQAALADAERVGAERLAQHAREALGLVSRPATSGVARTHAGCRASVLTAREREVLALIAHGISNQEIGDRLCISPFTVKRHIANILTKLDLPTRAAAAAFAIRECVAP